MNELGISLGEAERFLTLLSEAEEVIFQTFSDRDETKVKKTNGEPYDPLAHIRHGSLEHHGRELQRLNRGAAGIFVTVNTTNGHGRKAENVIRVRAVFVDLDGTLLPKTWGLEPHLIIESSPGRFHAYWRVSDCPLERFTSIQKAIAARFGGDPSVHDLPRVMRLPGFLHQKREPFLTRIVHENPVQPYTLAEIITGLGLDLNGGTRTGPKATDDGRIPEGGRNIHLASLAGSMRRRGMSPAAIEAALLIENAERCDPPLPQDEVRGIAISVSRYEPKPGGEEPPPWEDPPVEAYADDPECRGQDRNSGTRRGEKGEAGDRGQSEPEVTPWPKLHESALEGIVGEIVRAATQNSEADPAAVLMTALVEAGATIGTGPHILISETVHHARLFSVLVGASSRARKGTSVAPVQRIFETASQHIRRNSTLPFPGGLPLRISYGPLSSGEGLVYAVRDPVEVKGEDGEIKVVDEGVEDKRLLVIEGEFSAVLRACQREGNTLSAILRTAFDHGNIEPLTKHNRIKGQVQAPA
jgi:hypothetical protein